MDISRKYIDQLTYEIIGAAIEVHKTIGPGLLESVYHHCLRQEFNFRNIDYESELIIDLPYKGIQLEASLRCDFLVNHLVVVELKSVESIAPIFEAQVLSYMKLLNIPKGILLNFNASNLFKEGQKTFVNELYRSLPS